VEVLHLGLVDEAERELDLAEPLGEQGPARQRRQRVDVDRRGLAVADQTAGAVGEVWPPGLGSSLIVAQSSAASRCWP
jgi:hypothetical protein